MSSNPYLSNYVRFFQILSEMESEMLISQKEKHQLKVGLTLKDMTLINMIIINQDAEDEEFKYSIVNFLRKQIQSPTMRPPQKVRCKSTGMEMSPIKLIRRNSASKDSKITEDQLLHQIDDLNDSLVNILQSETKSVLTPIVIEKLKSISEVIQKSTVSSPSTTNTKINQEQDNSKLIDKFQKLYRDLKKHYTEYNHCHLLLMENNLSYEGLQKGLKNFVKNIVDADEFSILTVKDEFNQEIYYSNNDTIISLNNSNLFKETQFIQPYRIIKLEECNFQPHFNSIFQTEQYKYNFLLKINEQEKYICFHIKENKHLVSDLLILSEEFDIFEDVNQLSLFIIQTIQQAKIQIFIPLQISHMIQDIGIAFIRASKYLFIRKTIEILSKKYQVDKQINSGDAYSVVSSPSLMHFSQQKQVEFDFKDEQNITITINGMDLSKKSDLLVYKQLNLNFNKYQKFIQRCYDRITFYKFFVKSQDTLIFEFDKTGKLVFLSRPIPQSIQQQYNIHFRTDEKMIYTQIFQNEQLIKYVENFLQDQNKWILSDSDQQYQVFMKMQERSFKGFFIIFQQGWFKYDQKKFDFSDPSLRKEIQNTIIKQEAIQYVDKLEQNNPQILDSVVQMFKPRYTERQTIHYRNSILQFEAPKIGQKHSSLLQIEHFKENIDFINLNNFHFNILEYENQIKKQQVVFKILQLHNCLDIFNIEQDILCNFLNEVEYQYNKRNNVFHNFDHGVSVMQNIHAILLLLHETKNSQILPLFNEFALLLSGLCHDISHTGRTNTFEINSLSHLSLRYHDRSVLEQHHAAKTMKLLCVPQTNILQHLKPEEFRQFRKLLISNILYTDITEHFGLMKSFESKTQEQLFGEQEEDKKLISAMIIHTSDFTGGAKKFELSKQWSLRVNKEFEMQYELEGKLGYPQLPYMKDLDQLPIMAKQEAGFFKFIVQPLWQSMSKFLDDKLQEQVDNLEESEKYIQDLSAKIRYHNFATSEERLERGKVHVCSRTLIFEPERQELPIQKLFYKMITSQPKLQGNTIQFKIRRIVEIFTQGPPSPYIYQDDIDIEIVIEPLFDNVKTVFDLLDTIFTINQKKHDVEGEVEKLDSEKLQKARFNMSFVESVSEKPLIQKEMLVRKIMPLIQTKGLLYITNKTIYFQPFYKVSTKPCKKITIESIKNLYKRRFELLDIGLEIIMNNDKTVYFAFESQEKMEEVYKVLIPKVTLITETSLEKIQYLWQTGQISNFDYLLRLNQAGNRSTSDLTQYPVFPLILVDYDSSELNLNDRSVYRDLRKPIGALNEKRLTEFKNRYADMPTPKFLYGTHYSTPGYVIGYLIRQKPQFMLKLQSGKFDKPDRLFKSIKGDFKNVMNNPTSLKELIPEFFMEDDSFLVNKLNLDLGIRQNGKKVGDVKLPKWAKSAKEYLKINRDALESEYVSNELHHWIDLIFGYKQKGPSSVESDNVFHYLTYEGTVTMSSLNDPIERQAITCQINEFGQCPKQLFKIPHPPRSALKTGQVLYKSIEQIPKQEEQQKQQQQQQQVQEGLIWENLDKETNNKVISKAHKSNITDMVVLEKKNLLVTIGNDGFLKVIDLKELQVLKSFKVDEFCLSVIVTLKQDEIFAIGSWGPQIHVFNINYGSKVQVVQRFNNAVSSLVYLQKKKILVTGSWDCSLKKFECSETQIKQDTEEMIDDWEAQITNIAASDDESYIAVGDVDGKVITISTSNWTVQHQFEINGEKIVKLLFFKTNLLVVGDLQIKLLNNGSQLLDFKIDKNQGLISDILVDREKYLLVATKKGHLAIFSMLLESKLGYLYTDFQTQPDLLINQDQQFTKLALKEKTLILASHNGSLNILSQ